MHIWTSYKVLEVSRLVSDLNPTPHRSSHGNSFIAGVRNEAFSSNFATGWISLVGDDLVRGLISILVEYVLTLCYSKPPFLRTPVPRKGKGLSVGV